MGLLRENGRNISVASCNGYTVEKVIKAKQYLKEIGNNRRGFDVNRLVEMYNDIKGTKEKAAGCKPCAATKYYNGIQNYAYFGELTLINNGKCTKEDLDLDLIAMEYGKDLHDSELEGEEAFTDMDGAIITVTPDGLKFEEIKENEEALDNLPFEKELDENGFLIEEEEPKKEDIKERMAKVRAAKKNKKKND